MDSFLITLIITTAIYTWLMLLAMRGWDIQKKQIEASKFIEIEKARDKLEIASLCNRLNEVTKAVKKLQEEKDVNTTTQE